MQRVTPRDRDRAVRRLTTATGAITAGSIALTGAFMTLAKHDTDAKTALKNQQKAAALAAQQFALTDADPVTADGGSPTEGPQLQPYTPPASTTAPTTSTSVKKKTTAITKKKTTTTKKVTTSTAAKVAPTTSTTNDTPTQTYTPPPPPPPSPKKTKQPPAQSSGS